MLGLTVLGHQIGPPEAELIRQSGLREFPPRLFWQPIFYPATKYQYACKIARDWNTKTSQVNLKAC